MRKCGGVIGHSGVFGEESQAHAQQEIKCHPRRPPPGTNTPWVWSRHCEVSHYTIPSLGCPVPMGSVTVTFPPPLSLGRSPGWDRHSPQPRPVTCHLPHKGVSGTGARPGQLPNPAAPWQCRVEPSPSLSTDLLEITSPLCEGVIPAQTQTYSCMAQSLGPHSRP